MASPKMPRAVSAATSDLGAGRYPRPLLFAVLAWVLLGVTLLLSGIGRVAPTDAEETDNATGVQAVRAPAGDAQWFTGWLWVLGVLVLVFAVLLALGMGWTRLVLALLGMLSVVALAMSGSLAAIPAIVFFLIGCVGVVMISAHRYLTRSRTGTEAGRVTT